MSLVTDRRLSHIIDFLNNKWKSDQPAELHVSFCGSVVITTPKNVSKKNKHTYLMASLQDNLGKPVPERKSHSMDINEARNYDFGMVVASAEPCAISVAL